MTNKYLIRLDKRLFLKMYLFDNEKYSSSYAEEVYEKTSLKSKSLKG